MVRTRSQQDARSSQIDKGKQALVMNNILVEDEADSHMKHQRQTLLLGNQYGLDENPNRFVTMADFTTTFQNFQRNLIERMQEETRASSLVFSRPLNQDPPLGQVQQNQVARQPAHAAPGQNTAMRATPQGRRSHHHFEAPSW